MDDTTPLAGALAWTSAIVSRTTIEDYVRSTPCTEWDVRTLANHLIGGTWMFSGAVRGEPLPAGDPGDLVGDDPGAAYGRASAALLAAIGTAGALERAAELPIGTVPGIVAVRLALTDTLTHGWDLAVATGQPADLPPDLAELALAFCNGAVSDDMRGPSAPFAAVVTPPDDATAGEQLVAFLGRNPRP